MDNSAISIHSLRVEGDTMRSSARGIKSISIHSLRVEGDAAIYSKQKIRRYFNPLPPCGGRHIKRWALTEGEDISIHSLRVEGDQANLLPMLASMISIHSLRVEGDCDNIFFCRRRKDFNPLPPCGGRLLPQYSALVVTRFQSTPSVWRETMDGSGVYQRLRFQSTPSVWRETRCFLSARSPSSISIHSLRVEGDEKIVWRCAISWTFQSTPSVWRETCHV